MTQTRFIVFLLLCALGVNAQKTKINGYSGIDAKALQCPDSLTKSADDIASYMNGNFHTDKVKVRGIFIWIAGNIKYDAENMFALNFYEKKEDKIAKPLKTRKGICENYAALFTEICTKSGIKSFVIEGYTKQNGFADYLPHAWCGALIDTSWFLFDPTWGSGYLIKGKFYPEINNDYFLVNPSMLIKSHMPFDCLWQFLNYPVTNQEFYEGKTQENKSKAYFSYQDSIPAFEKMSHTDQLAASASRIEKAGIKNSLIFDRLQHIKIELENEKQTHIADLYNDAVIDYNDGIAAYNDFINYRNKQFTPKKTDPEIKAMLDTASVNLQSAKTKLAEIIKPDATTSKLIQQLSKPITESIDLVNEQQDWLKIYFSKPKASRKLMFYKK